MAELLRLDAVTAGYGESVVVEEASFAIGEGEAGALLGRNGVGKTTLLATVMGLTHLHPGSMRWEGGGGFCAGGAGGGAPGRPREPRPLAGGILVRREAQGTRHEARDERLSSSLPGDRDVGGRRHQPGSVLGLYRPGPLSPRARTLLLHGALVLRGPRGRDPQSRRLQAYRDRRALGDPRARQRWRGERRRERVRPSRRAVPAPALRQPARFHLPLSPVVLLAEGRPAGRAVEEGREAGRARARRHAAAIP